MDLDEMKVQRARLDRQIKEAEKSAENLRATAIIGMHYLRVVCPHCEGRGVSLHPSFSDNSDLDERDCQDCGGRGYLLGRRWEGPKGYDLEFNQIVSGNA